MDTDAVAKERLRNSQFHNSKLCRYFYLLSLVGLVVILIVAGLVLRHVVWHLIILEAEEDAMVANLVKFDAGGVLQACPPAQGPQIRWLPGQLERLFRRFPEKLLFLLLMWRTIGL